MAFKGLETKLNTCLFNLMTSTALWWYVSVELKNITDDGIFLTNAMTSSKIKFEVQKLAI